MDPREIIRRGTSSWEDEDSLIVLVDTPSMNEQISYGNNTAQRLLQYHSHSLFDFIRTPGTARFDEIEKIHPYSLEKNDNEDWGIHINPDEEGQFSTTRAYGLLYEEDDIRDIAGRIFEDKKGEIDADVNPTQEQVKTVRKVFIQSSINWDESGNIFIIEKDEILSNRRWFEGHFPGGELNIMTLDEAVEYLGLYARFRDEYPIHPCMNLDTTGWYWRLFRTLVPHFHVEQTTDDHYLRGFGTRIQNLLIATDELGYLYFQKPDNRTQLNMKYHFDHAISLITGTFDVLALKTSVIYNISGLSKEQISLTNNRGRKFLKRVRSENSVLRDHITDYMEYINFIYTLRPLVIHRGGYQDVRYRNENENWTSGMIAINRLDEEYRREFSNRYREVNNELLSYDPIDIWGVYQSEGDDPELVEPYHFLKTAVTELVTFSDEYLRLLGYDNFFETIKDSNKDNDFLNWCITLQKDALTQFHKMIVENTI